MLVCWATETGNHRWSMAKTTDIDFLTVLEPGNSRSRCCQDWFLARPFWLAGSHLPAESSRGLSSVPAYSGISSSFFKNIAFGLGPQPFATSFHLDYFFKGPISKYSNIGSEDFNLRIWGEQNSVHYSYKQRRKWQPTPVFLPGESPWTEEPGGLQSMESQSQTQLSDLTHTHTQTHTQL